MTVVVIKPKAEKQLSKLPDDVQDRFSTALSKMEESEEFPTPGLDVGRLKVEDGWKLRVGAYRGLFTHRSGTATFERFGHRRNVYD